MISSISHSSEHAVCKSNVERAFYAW